MRPAGVAAGRGRAAWADKGTDYRFRMSGPGSVEPGGAMEASLKAGGTTLQRGQTWVGPEPDVTLWLPFDQEGPTEVAQ